MAIHEVVRESTNHTSRLFRAAAIYGFGAFFGIEQVVTGQSPLWSLAFLPISLGFIWMYVRAARRISVPPGK
jgi:hypothetical protein